MLIGFPCTEISQQPQRFDLAKKMADCSGMSLGVIRFMAQQFAHDTQHALRFTVGADTDLKPPRAKPCLVQRPAVADLTQHLRLMHAAIFEH